MATKLITITELYLFGQSITQNNQQNNLGFDLLSLSQKEDIIPVLIF